MTSPTLVTSNGTTSNTSTSLSTTGGVISSADATAGYLLGVMVVHSGDATVTGTIGGGSGIAADINANDGTRYIRAFSKILASGDLSSGNLTVQPSILSVGTIKRIEVFVYKSLNGWDSARVAAAVQDTTTGASMTLTATDSAYPSVAIAAITQASTPASPGHTYDWDLGASGGSDFPGGTNTQACSVSSVPGSVTTTGYDTGVSGESVTISGIGSSQNRIAMLIVYQVKAPKLMGSASSGTSSAGSAGMKVVKRLSGAGATASDGNSNLTTGGTVIVPITARSATVSAGTASLYKPPKPLAGSGGTASYTFASLNSPFKRTGAGATASAASAALKAVKRLVGRSATTSAGAGVILYKKQLAGSGGTASGGAASLGVVKHLQGAGASSSGGSGPALATPGGYTSYSATTSAGSATGLSTNSGIHGSGASASSGSATISVSRGLSGRSASTSAGRASLGTASSYTSASATVTAGSGALRVVKDPLSYPNYVEPFSTALQTSGQLTTVLLSNGALTTEQES